MLELLLALLAGIVTIAAPCTLPMLPILLGAAVGNDSAARPTFIALGFVVSFTFVGLLLNSVTQAFGFDPATLRSAAVLLLFGFGLLLIWPHQFERLTARIVNSGYCVSIRSPRRHSGNIGGFLLGTTLGLVWTPCAGPVLGSILTVIATSANTAWSSVLLLTYALGAAIPMLAIAYGGQAVTTRVRSLARLTPQLQRSFGVIIVIFATVMYLQYDALAIAWLSGFYPNGQIGL